MTDAQSKPQIKVTLIITLSQCFSFRECFFRRRLQPVNCAIVSCVQLL